MRQAGRYMAEYRAIRARHGFLELCKNSDAAAEVTLQPVDTLGVDAAILFADILLIVEIAESSLEYDRRVKAPMFARLGVPEYWLADLVAEELSCYSRPEGGAYHDVQQYHRGQTAAARLLPDCSIAVDDLLAG